MYHLCREFPLYAPVADLSVKFCFANRKDGHSPVSQLTLFNAAHGKCNNDMMLNTAINNNNMCFN